MKNLNVTGIQIKYIVLYLNSYFQQFLFSTGSQPMYGVVLYSVVYKYIWL